MLSVDHPYIAKFYEAFLDHEYVHLVVEYCEGGDLCTKLEKIGKFQEKDVKSIVKQCLKALNHLHTHNIVHRDMKLENILVDGTEIKIIDFGISTLLRHENEFIV